VRETKTTVRTRQASWTAAVLRRFFDASPKIHLTKGPFILFPNPVHPVNPVEIQIPIFLSAPPRLRVNPSRLSSLWTKPFNS
jgi:hypothetical protein